MNNNIANLVDYKYIYYSLKLSQLDDEDIDTIAFDKQSIINYYDIIEIKFIDLHTDKYILDLFGSKIKCIQSNTLCK